MEQIKVKKRCCKDTPRCKKCPVVLKRLERAGLAERVGPRDYVMPRALKKKELKPYR
jgi:hypothetical protein